MRLRLNIEKAEADEPKVLAEATRSSSAVKRLPSQSLLPALSSLVQPCPIGSNWSNTGLSAEAMRPQQLSSQHRNE